MRDFGGASATAIAQIRRSDFEISRLAVARAHGLPLAKTCRTNAIIESSKIIHVKGAQSQSACGPSGFDPEGAHKWLCVQKA